MRAESLGFTSVEVAVAVGEHEFGRGLVAEVEPVDVLDEFRRVFHVLDGQARVLLHHEIRLLGYGESGGERRVRFQCGG